MAASDDCGHIRFFSFSLIEGYISLVMDVQTQQRWAGPCVDVTGGLGGSTGLSSWSVHPIFFTGVVPVGAGVTPGPQQDGAKVEIGTVVPKPSVPCVSPQH